MARLVQVHDDLIEERSSSGWIIAIAVIAVLVILLLGLWFGGVFNTSSQTINVTPTPANPAPAQGAPGAPGAPGAGGAAGAPGAPGASAPTTP